MSVRGITSFALPVLLLLTACSGTGPTQPLTPTGPALATALPRPTTEEGDALTTEPEAATAGARLVGLWNVPLQDLQEVSAYGVNAVFFAAEGPAEVQAYLAAARSVNLKVVLNLVPAESAVDPVCAREKGRGGCPFDPEAFRAALETYRQVDFSPWHDTLYAHMLLDEPFDPSNWGGVPTPVEALQAAAEASRDLLGPVPTAINFGYLGPDLAPGVTEVALSTFYANKLRRFGSLEAYLQDQLANLEPLRRENPALKYLVLLQAFGGERYGPFPSAEDMAAQGQTACRTPGVDGLFWWTWSKPRLMDFASVLHGPEAEAYRAMVARVAAVCAGPMGGEKRPAGPG